MLENKILKHFYREKNICGKLYAKNTRKKNLFFRLLKATEEMRDSDSLIPKSVIRD